MLQESIDHSGKAACKLLEACTDLQGQWANTCNETIKAIMDERWSETYHQPYRLSNDWLKKTVRWQMESLASATKVYHNGLYAFTPGMRDIGAQYESLVDQAVTQQLRAFDSMVDQLYAPIERLNELAFECLAAGEEFSERIVSLGAREASKTAASIDKEESQRAA